MHVIVPNRLFFFCRPPKKVEMICLLTCWRAFLYFTAVDYIQRLLDQKNELKNRVRDLQVNLGESADGDESVSCKYKEDQPLPPYLSPPFPLPSSTRQHNNHH